METENNTEELALHAIRMNAAEKRREIRKALKIGHIICEYSWRSKHNNWGRFGGGWNWKLGVQAASKCVIVSLLVCELRFSAT